MNSKTLQLINQYRRLLTERGDDPNLQSMDGDSEQPPQDVQDVVDPNAPADGEELPLTSQGENNYISNLIDAALFEPSAEEATTLLNLQNVMQLKRYKNAREEVLPLVLSLISSETQAGDIKKDLNSI